MILSLRTFLGKNYNRKLKEKCWHYLNTYVFVTRKFDTNSILVTLKMLCRLQLESGRRQGSMTHLLETRARFKVSATALAPLKFPLQWDLVESTKNIIAQLKMKELFVISIIILARHLTNYEILYKHLEFPYSFLRIHINFVFQADKQIYFRIYSIIVRIQWS